VSKEDRALQPGAEPFLTAYKLHTLGFTVIPSGGGDSGKAPLVNWKEWQDMAPDDGHVQDWNAKLRPQLWGIITNERIAVLDADTPEARAQLEAELGAPHVLTPRGGAHWYLDTEGHPMRTIARLLPGIDVRGVGGFVNIAGGNYQVMRLPVPGDNLVAWGSLPARFIEALNGTKPATASPVPEQISEGQRNAVLTSIAGTMRRRGASQESIEAALIAENKARCAPPLAEHEVRKIAGSVARYQPHEWGQSRFNLTDYGNAERLRARFGDSIRFCTDRSRWLVWAGRAWAWDSSEDTRVYGLAKKTVRTIYAEAANEADDNARKALAAWARASESDGKIRAMIALARSEPGIPVSLEELDRDPWLFNLRNGTLNLHTGELREHRRSDLLTMLAPVEYNPGAPCPLWLKFLERVTGGNNALIHYLQKAVGYSLTGDTRQQVCFFLYGHGLNGKSTFTNTIRKLAGPYGERLSADVLMKRDQRTGGPREGLANLKGKRFVVASELEEGQRLAVSLLKDMTGGESIKADRKYEHEIEFQPTHKVWLTGNHKPVITDTTLSIWRRMKLIPFNVTIPANEIDIELPQKLEHELPGILAWCVAGCLAWQREGMTEPSAVTDATAQYRQEQDILGDFITDCCLLDSSATIKKSELWNTYQAWCSENGVHPVGQRTFRARLLERDVVDKKSGSTRFWIGVGLRDMFMEPQHVQKGQLGQERPLFTETSTREEIQGNFMQNPVAGVPTVPDNADCIDPWYDFLQEFEGNSDEC